MPMKKGLGNNNESTLLSILGSGSFLHGDTRNVDTLFYVCVLWSVLHCGRVKGGIWEVINPSIPNAGRLAYGPRYTGEIYEWARHNLWLPPGYSIQGEFHVEISNHLVEPFKAIRDPSVRLVGMEKAVQIFGTGLIDISIPYFLANKPGSILLVMQTEQVARAHSKTRIMPLIRSCRKLADMMPRIAGSESVQELILTTGVPLWIFGPAVSGLQSKSIRYNFGDECWLWEPGVWENFSRRKDAYERIGNDKTILVSQGSENEVVNGVEIRNFFDDIMRTGTDEWWCPPCPVCKEHFLPKFEYLDDNGERYAGLMWDKMGAQVHYVCPKCKQSFGDSPNLKSEWNKTARYFSQNPNPKSGRRTFHANAIPFKDWSKLAELFIDATQALKNGSIEKLKAFVQKEGAETWIDRQSVQRIVLQPTGFGEKSSWADELFRVMIVDVQNDHFWVLIRAWAADGRSRLLIFKKLHTWDELRAIQIEFGVKDEGVFVDEMYGRRTAEVRRECYAFTWSVMRGSDYRDFNHVIPDPTDATKTLKVSKLWRNPPAPEALIGIHTEDMQNLVRRFSPKAMAVYNRGDFTVKCFEWAGPSIREIFVTLRDGKGVEFLPYDGVPIEYRKQIMGQERRMKNNKQGHPVEEWVVVGPDHAFDAECMSICVAAWLDVLKV